MDCLSIFFSGMLEAHDLIDFAPIPIGPTWRNDCEGTEGNSKRLDRFIMKQSLFNHLVGVNSDIIPSVISDH